MDTQEAVQILDRHNRWRRGADIEMENPTLLGIAIDEVVTHIKGELKDESKKVSGKPA